MLNEPLPVLTGVITRQLWSSVDRTHFHHEKKWPRSPPLKMDALITGLTLAPMCLFRHMFWIKILATFTFLVTFFTFTLQPPRHMAPASSVGPNDWEIQRLWDEDRSTCHPCYASALNIWVATFPKKLTAGTQRWRLEDVFFHDFLLPCLFSGEYIKGEPTANTIKIIRDIISRSLLPQIWSIFMAHLIDLI